MYNLIPNVHYIVCLRTLFFFSFVRIHFFKNTIIFNFRGKIFNKQICVCLTENRFHDLIIYHT